MDLGVVLWAYLIFTLLIFIFLWWIGIKPWSALILALIAGFILLNILLPPCEAHCYVDCGSAYALYIFIQFATILFVFFYAVIMAIRDRACQVYSCPCSPPRVRAC